MAYNSDLGFKPNMNNADLDIIRVQIRMLSDVAAQYANTSGVHALAGGYSVTMPSPAEFRKSIPALQAQNCPELAQAGRIIGTLGNPDGERVYHPFWDAIPFFIDGAGLHPKLFAVLALEQQMLEDAYKERFPSSYGDGIEIHISWKEFLKFAMKLGEVHPVNDKEFKYLDVKRQRIELQNKLWKDGKLPDRGGPNLDKMWNSAYPGCATRPKTFQKAKVEVDDEFDELDEVPRQQDGVVLPWLVPRTGQEQQEQQGQLAGPSTQQQQPAAPSVQQQQPAGPSMQQKQQLAGPSTQQQQSAVPPPPPPQQPAGSSVIKRGPRGPYKRTTKNLLPANTAPAQPTPGAAAAPTIPAPQVPAKRPRADSPQRQVTPAVDLLARITDMEARHRRQMGDMQQQLAVLRDQLHLVNNECAARTNSMIGIAVQGYATRNTVLERRILALEAANAAATGENRQLRTRLAEVSTENMYLQGRLDDVTIGGGGRAHCG